ncbi:MAG: CHAT domain-containing protein, partial [Cyclobacteriaceae bacterium]|nr:CHAT domain-containing protein [Cyclobacteriaceae bacterium]
NPDSLFNLRNQLIRKLDRKAILNKELVNNKDLSINSDKETFDVKDAQNLISDKNEILIEYHWSNDHVYAFLIGKEIADIVKIEKTNELLTNIEKFANALSNHSIQKDDFKKYTASAYFLYDKLIKPIENRTSQYFGKDKIKRLIIVPDGPLSTLPFEAFISELDTSSNSYWGLDYLCRKYIVSYAYSLNILKNNLSRQKEIKNPKMLALSYSEKIDESSDIEQLRFENELPYSEEEIRRIRKRIKSTCYLGIDATEGIFKAKASAYSMIHLALHGQADTVDMFNSRLIFKKDSTSNEDGELRAYELYDMDLSEVQMVVLSACETGIGKQYEGEGIFSIARGFAYAGCPSIVMSLWKVNDKATADLIDFFYANLKDKVPKDEALRNAKLAYIEKSDDLNAHPSNWAAF